MLQETTDIDEIRAGLNDSGTSTKVGSMPIVRYLAHAMHVEDWQLFRSTELFETALARCCVSLGATGISETDIANIAGHASWDVTQTYFALPPHGYVFVDYKTLTAAQRTEMVRVLNEKDIKAFTLEDLGQEIAALTQGGWLFGEHSKRNLMDLVHVRIADICDKLVPLLPVPSA